MPDVLLIEDDPLSATVLGDMLQTLGYQVTPAHTGKEAAKLVAAGLRPRLVITDILMPDMDGIEIVQHFKASLPDTPVIAMSGAPHGSYLRAAQHLGARLTLAKPFTLLQLQEALQEALAPGDGARPPA